MKIELIGTTDELVEFVSCLRTELPEMPFDVEEVDMEAMEEPLPVIRAADTEKMELF